MASSSSLCRENFPPQILQRVAKEIRQLVQNPLDGIRYVPQQEEQLTEIHVEIKGPEKTPYENGVFQVKICLCPGFPLTPPKGIFKTKIFHPNIATNGDICVNTLKRDWSPELGIAHVLQVIRCLLIVPFPESSLNDEAGKLFMTSYEEYARRARIMTSIHASPKTTRPSSSLSSSSSSTTDSSATTLSLSSASTAADHANNHLRYKEQEAADSNEESPVQNDSSDPKDPPNNQTQEEHDVVNCNKTSCCGDSTSCSSLLNPTKPSASSSSTAAAPPPTTTTTTTTTTTMPLTKKRASPTTTNALAQQRKKSSTFSAKKKGLRRL